MLTSIALMTAFTQRVQLNEINLVATGMTDPQHLMAIVEARAAYIVPGILIGTLLPFVFSALTMLAVGKSAQSIIQEVRRQFREIPGLLEGTQGKARRVILSFLIVIRFCCFFFIKVLKLITHNVLRSQLMPLCA